MLEEFLSAEYTNWLNNLFSKANDIFNKEDKKKLNILFNYVKEYLNSDLSLKEEKDYYLNTRSLTYDFTYNGINLEIAPLLGADLMGRKLRVQGYHIIKVSDIERSKLEIPSIDLNKVKEFTVINSKKEEDKALYTLIQTVNKLENAGIKREVLINDLQITYAYLVNKDTREKHNTKGR